MDPWILKVILALHMTFAVLFVGGNVFMDFLLTPRLELIPPGQAARLGEKLGTDFAIFNFVCLGGIIITGPLVLWRLGLESQMFSGAFVSSAYGAALLIKELIWTSLVITGSIMTFYLRPRVIVKLPYDASREKIEGDREKSIDYSKYLRWMARYNGIAGVVAVVMAAFLSRGGLW
jgi:uncharacterized membrane protein